MPLRASFSNVIAVVALLVALTGSAAAATLASTSPVNNSDVRFGGQESSTAVHIKPNQSGSVALGSVSFTTSHPTSAVINGTFAVTNTSSQPVTVELVVGMKGMAEKYKIDQTILAGANQQITLAGLLCNGMTAGKNRVSFTATSTKLGDGNVTFGFRTIAITDYNPRKLALGG